jgi:hypothetical protein
MSKVTSSRGSEVDFELMTIMANINAGKAPQKLKSNTPKYYNVEQDIPYVEAISTEQFLRAQLANSIPTEAPIVEVAEVAETPVSLEIVEPSTENDDIDEKSLDNITEAKNNKRK